MVVETRRGKRKENPTEEEGPRVKFAKTGSGENVEKTTTEESETRAVKVVESTAKTTDESTAKTTDVSMEMTQTTDKESSNQDHEDSEEEPPDGENEVNARSEEEQANGEGEEEANENGNPPEPHLLAFEAIPKLGLAFREPVEEADVNCPRMCKSSFKRNGMTGVSLSAIKKELSNTTVKERLLDDILEDEDDVDESDIAVDSWEKCLDAGYKVFFQDMHDEDVVARQKQAEASEAAGGDGIEAGEQSIQLGDVVMKLVKRTLKLMRTVDKKVNQLDGRLASLEEFVKEA
ncbi:hypothetical protein Bca52824_083378 [Brassica carinata]|uniref:DUF287 domain-containing protein n=1 Tax=Brassica carinata TaxID=52824 RepID=A0A8X7PM67_BRACI|nr:hypothetical protein Bca52824_083378 [Brassica carinata]